MKEKILLLIVLCMTQFMGLKAQTLLIWNGSDVVQRIELKKRPIVKVLDDKLVITGEDISLEYGINDARRFTFEDVQTGVKGEPVQPQVQRVGNRIVLCNVTSADDVSIYTLDGIRVPLRVEPEGDNMVLQLNMLSSGVYLLTVNGRTTKLMKR